MAPEHSENQGHPEPAGDGIPADPDPFPPFPVHRTDRVYDSPWCGLRRDEVILPDGKVLVAGGNSTGGDIAELFDPATNTWSSAGALTARRALHSAVLLTDGSVLLAGGSGGGSYLRSADRLETVSRVVMASNLGTAGLTAAQAAGSIYYQNNPNATGAAG